MTRFARSVSIFAFALTLVSLGATAAEAQERLAGTWQLASSSEETAERRAAIEAALEDMPAFVRSRARERLNSRMSPQSQFRIAVSGDRVELSRAGRTLTLTVGGPAVEVEGENGSGQVQATRRNGYLVVTMRGERGVRTTLYQLSRDGQRLVLDVHMNGERLSTPIRFRVTYRRA